MVFLTTTTTNIWCLYGYARDT